jgi:DNA-binding transcriptional MerR regulator
VRSLRVLQDKGLLPPPALRGRTGWYDDHHLARVRLVLRLQQRGFTLSAINELIRAWENGRNLSDVLGLEEALTNPWTEEAPGRATQAELEARIGQCLTPEQLERMVRIGTLTPDGDGYVIPSPALIAAGIEMVKTGLPLDAVLDVSTTLGADLRAVAGRLTDSVAEYLVSDTPDGLPDDNVMELIGTIDRLRAQAGASVSVWFALMMDEAVADYVSSMSTWAREDDDVAAGPDPVEGETDGHAVG